MLCSSAISHVKLSPFASPRRHRTARCLPLSLSLTSNHPVPSRCGADKTPNLGLRAVRPHSLGRAPPTPPRRAVSFRRCPQHVQIFRSAHRACRFNASSRRGAHW
ncbi:hypothetical protein ABZP36_019179 [Zizania latifolia]